MKKLRGSFLAKAVAWVVLITSTVTFLFSVIAAVVCQENGIYNKQKQDVLQDVYKDIAQRYAYRAMDYLDDTGKSSNEMYFSDTNFKYGIIKASEADAQKMDLNAESTYLQRNFTETVTEDSYWTFPIKMGKDTQFHYGDSIFDTSGYVWNDTDSADWVYIDRIVYEMQSGIFYYECEGTYYPVQSVEIPIATEENDFVTLRLTYVPKEEKYQVVVEQNTTTIVNSEQNTTTTVDSGEQTTNQQELQDVINQITQKGNIGLSELDGTLLGYDKWDTVLLDGDTYGFGEGVTQTIWASDNHKAKNVSYEVEDDGSYLYVRSQQEKTAYTVLVQKPQEPLKNECDWKNGDLFVQAQILVSYGYRFAYLFFVIIAVSAVFMLASFVFLMCAAGHRKETDEIMLTWLDRIPTDLYTGIVLIVESLLLAGMTEISYRIYDGFFWSFWFFAGVFAAGILGMMCLLSIAVRVKTKTIWKNTIIGKIIRVCWRFGKNTIEQIPMAGKAAVIYVGLSILELIVIAITGYAPGAEVFFWMIGKVLLAVFLLRVVSELRKLQDAGKHIAAGEVDYKVDTTKMLSDFKEHGENLNHIGDGISKAVDERMKSERFKTELITNVSHDIETPLTSIINYVDLLQKEELNNPTAQEYLEVLDRQSSRLKKLIEDLIEASKASTGNLSVQMERCEAGVFLVQTVGEFKEKTDAANLELIIKKPEEPVYIMADGRHFWRIIDNMMNNICKYAQPGTRVYINLEQAFGTLTITFRNTSRAPLNISSEELMERFVRGDSSRNTEGNGLGLNIAKSLTELMQGTFKLIVDGDLFKVVLTFPVAPAPQAPQQVQTPQQPI